MAKKKNRKQDPEQDIIQEAGLSPNWGVVESEPIIPGAPKPGATPPLPNAMPSHFVGTLNPDMQHDTSFVGTQVASPRIASTPLMPAAPSGNPQTNAAIRSTTILTQTTTGASTIDKFVSAEMTFRGTWRALTSYAINDVVLFNFSSYIATTASTNLRPDSNPTNWTLLGKNLNFRGVWTIPLGIQTASSFTSNGVSTNVTLATPVQVGSTILVSTMVHNIGSAAVPALSDNQGNIYTLVIDSGRIHSNAFDTQTWQTTIKAAGSLTVNVVWTNGGPPGNDAIFVTEVPATISAGVAGATFAAQSSSGAGPFPSMSLGVSFSGQLLYTAALAEVIGALIAPSGYASVSNSFSTSMNSVAWTSNSLSTGNTIQWQGGFPVGGGDFCATAVAMSIGNATNYNPFDVVEYNGSLWLCVVGTNSTPSYVNPDWVIFAPATGFANLKSANYTATLDDEGKLLSFNSSSALTLMLPATPPDSGWWITVENIGSGTLTINPNGLSIDGLASLILTTNQGVAVFTDGFNYYTFRGASSSIGGVAVKTASYTAVLNDSGELLSFNGSNLTLTLPNPSPSPKWIIFVQNLNSTNLTISPNGLNIDGSAASLVLGQNQGIIIFTDGTNYFTNHGVNRITVPSFLTASSPDGSGNVTVSLANQNAKTFLGGPVACSGAAPPTFRQPQGTDFVNLNISSASGINVTSNQSGNLRLCGAVLPAGLYRVSMYVVVTVTGTGNISMTITWNDGTASQSYSPSNITTTVLGTIAQFDIVVLSDGVHDIAWAISLI
jgi:hypothetical protein